MRSIGLLLISITFVSLGWRIYTHTSGLLFSPEISQINQSPVSKPEVPELSLEKIFKDTHQIPENIDKSKLVTLLATGDIIPARSVNYQISVRHDPTWPYLETAEVLRNNDITFSNLETPLFSGCTPTQEGMVFCGDLSNIKGLEYGGVDIVSLANNHAGNYGEEGVSQTIKDLNDAGIDVTGIDSLQPLIYEVKGTKFAFLGYNDITTPQPGVSNAEEEKIKKQIQEAKKSADIVVVTYHWGVEYRDQPDERQKYLGHLTIDAGADLVIGNHPHWYQPIEFYHGKLITYAHGNFVFDQEWSRRTKEGIVGRYTFYNKV